MQDLVEAPPGGLAPAQRSEFIDIQPINPAAQQEAAGQGEGSGSPGTEA
ncbi:MAG: hypothetical protein ACO4B5_11025 [Steroidobacteraceae bacterium]